MKPGNVWSLPAAGLCILAAFVMALSACGDDDPDKSGDDDPDTSADPDAHAICNDVVGLTAALPECTATNPCTHVAVELGETVIDTPSDAPACADMRWDERLRWEIDGTTRYACVYRPPNADMGGRPLVLFFHPGGVGANVAEQETLLLDKAAAYDLGEPGDTGFVLAVVQGRNLHFPTVEPRDGRHHDFYHRDLGQPKTNPDIKSADTLVDTLVAEGSVRADRIYVMGWSNGAFFGQIYAIARHETPTAGGHRVAAAAVFAAASPFDNIEYDPFADLAYSGPSCKLASIPASTVPIQLTHRTCDLTVPCGASDAACFGNEPGYVTTRWLSDAASALSGLEGRLIGGVEPGNMLDAPVQQCANVDSSCNVESCIENPSGVHCLCLVNHLRWPDGAYPTRMGIDNEPAMLDFLRMHALL